MTYGYGYGPRTRRRGVIASGTGTSPSEPTGEPIPASSAYFQTDQKVLSPVLDNEQPGYFQTDQKIEV